MFSSFGFLYSAKQKRQSIFCYFFVYVPLEIDIDISKPRMVRDLVYSTEKRSVDYIFISYIYLYIYIYT